MISIIIPFYNEGESIPILINQLISVCNKNSYDFEVILVDDGSTDNSTSNVKNQTSKLQIKNQIFAIPHKKRLGKGEALSTGVKSAKGEIIIFMDADLQDDPSDLPAFIQKINEGYDFVNGVRRSRQESKLIMIYSRLAKYFLKKFAGSPYSDINCGFKAFRRQVLKNFNFYGNNFRFFPLAVFYNGFKVTEIQVKNNPRLFGKSKFGVGKLLGGVFDTLTAFFLYKFAESPLHFFGIIGGILFLAGFTISSILAVERLFFGVLLYQRPILWLGISLIIVGIQIVMTGVLGELIVYLSKKNPKS